MLQLVQGITSGNNLSLMIKCQLIKIDLNGKHMPIVQKAKKISNFKEEPIDKLLWCE